MNPFNGAFFLHSEGVGIYVHWAERDKIGKEVRVGDIVRVTGSTHEGQFNPCIIVGSLEMLGQKELPEARQFYTFEILSAKNDCDWVRLSGRLQSVQMAIIGKNDAFAVLNISNNGVLTHAIIPVRDRVKDESDLRELLFKRVSFNAVAGVQYNNHRQLVGRTFYINSVQDIVQAYEGKGYQENTAKFQNRLVF